MNRSELITLAHGSGGLLTQQLLDEIIRPAFSNTILNTQHDGANLITSGSIAFSTDSYVVQPMVFPGGDIGKLAVLGTINDLAMCGAKAKYLSCSLILTEGLSLSFLSDIISSMANAAKEANVQIVTGDIKTIEASSKPEMYINTTGIGEYFRSPLNPNLIQVGDDIILSGDVGRHGLAILCARENIVLNPIIESDCMNILPCISTLYQNGIKVHCLRDLTRGGLGGNLIELAKTCNKAFKIEESIIPIAQSVHAGCELLGLDPLYVANEGRFLLFCSHKETSAVLKILNPNHDPLGAVKIGDVFNAPTEVWLHNAYGARRSLHLPIGEQLPRIC